MEIRKERVMSIHKKRRSNIFYIPANKTTVAKCFQNILKWKRFRNQRAILGLPSQSAHRPSFNTGSPGCHEESSLNVGFLEVVRRVFS